MFSVAGATLGLEVTRRAFPDPECDCSICLRYLSSAVGMNRAYPLHLIGAVEL